MKFEFDIIFRNIEAVDSDEEIIFRPNSVHQYIGLCEQLLAPKQFENHIAHSQDGIFSVSAKRLKAGHAYMKDNPFNKKNINHE